MNYTIDTDAILWRPLVYLLLAFILVSAVLALAMWRRRHRLSLKALFLYVAFWMGVVVIVDRTWINARSHDAGWESSGLLYFRYLPEGEPQHNLHELINSQAFKLECGRNLASDRRLERLVARCGRWELSADEDEERGNSFPVVARADRLTLREKLIFDEWFDLWKSEAEHASMVTFLTENKESSLACDAANPAWTTTTSGAQESTSFDFPPQTQYVRKRMHQLAIEHENAGMRQYCLRMLKSAATLDSQVGQPSDPLCDVKAIDRQRKRRLAETSRPSE